MNWETIFFNGLPGLGRTVVAALFAYAGVILILRISGKHALSKMHVFDWVVTVALGSTMANILLSEDVALAEGLLAIAMLVSLQWIVAKASVLYTPWRNFLRSDPKIILRHGNVDSELMVSERVTEVEVDTAIRMRGFGDRSAIAFVVLESNGSLSVIPEDTLGDESAIRSIPDYDEPFGPGASLAGADVSQRSAGEVIRPDYPRE